MTRDEHQAIDALRADVAEIREDVRRTTELLIEALAADEAGDHPHEALDFGPQRFHIGL